MSHCKLTVYDDIPARALQGSQEAWLREAAAGRTRAWGQSRAGQDTQSSPVLAPQLLARRFDSVVKSFLPMWVRGRALAQRTLQSKDLTEITLGTQHQV